MAGKTSIEWTQQSWNPLVGCTILTAGCIKCYAMNMARRIEAMNATLRAQGKPHAAHYDGTTKLVNGKAVWTGVVRQAPRATLMAPLTRRVPTTYFVNSMSDLFHEDVPDSWIDEVFAVMAASRRHTYQVLTKRAARMRKYMTHPDTGKRIYLAARKLTAEAFDWPLPNVWLGVSIERQQEADARMPDLMATPAAVRFVSCEPLLGPLDLTPWLWGRETPCKDCPRDIDCECGAHPRHLLENEPALHLAIIGGESGHDARPFDLFWGRELLGQCADASVAAFMKQVGGHPIDSMCAAPRETLRMKDKKGGDPAEWPPELRVRQMPQTPKENP